MTPRSERFFSADYAKELLAIAQGDLESAKGLWQLLAGRRENICYHAQQSIEKSIKAVICWRGQAVPLAHDINLIKARLPDGDQPPIPEDLSELTQFATIRRYEQGPFELDEEDIRSIISLAEKTLRWAYERIHGKETHGT